MAKVVEIEESNGYREERRNSYWRKGQKFKHIYEVSKKKWRTELGMVVEKLKTESDLWEFVNNDRKKRRIVQNNIAEEEWIRHFREQLGVEKKQGR